MKKKSQDKKSKVPPIVLQALEFIKSPFFIGILTTCLFVFFARTYYEVRNQNRIDLNKRTLQNVIFQFVEGFDFILTDGRFLIRGEKKSEAPVALITIDDRSIEEIGRWPWSREKMAFMVEEMMKYEAKAIGFDIVFSEPQEDPRMQTFQKIESRVGTLSPELKQLIEEEKAHAQPDLILAKTFDKYKDKLVLGTFPDENQDITASEPYTDYCRNSAFNRANANKFIKIENVSFVVVDNTDLFESVNFDDLFKVIFDELEKTTTQEALSKEFRKKSVEELSEPERRKLGYMISKANMSYCDRWLSTNDEFGKTSQAFFDGLTKKVELFKGLTADEAIRLFSQKVLTYPMVQYLSWTINHDQIQEPAIYTASFAAYQDNDGKIRHNPLFFRTGNRLGGSFVPSLALQTYLIAHPGYQAEVEVDYDPKDLKQKRIKSFVVHDTNKDGETVVSIPTDGQGRLKINYAGGTRMYPYLPAKELFNGKPTMKIQEKVWNPDAKAYVDTEHEVDKATFIKDRTFLMGATAIGVYDLRVTPFEKNFPGPETHMNVLGNLFEANFLKTDPEESKKMTWALIVLGVLLSAAVSYAGPFAGFGVMMAAQGILLLLDQWFLKKGFVAAMVLPFLMIFAVYVFLTLYKYFTEEKKKREMKATFAKYVSPSVVDEILKSPENIELGGKKQRMSVFFSDVRGFTTISEKLEPQVLSDVLNAYLTPMTDIVFANKGTLDKYMGDAVMAFFGAPIHYPDHAKYACRCALASIQKLYELQKEFKAQGLPEIDIGIGINTSDMSVGNMGSNIVRSYTVMGDGVNLGSRLEGINKEYGTRIIISQFTYAEVKDSFTAREVDWVRVKGKLEPVQIYELICEGPPPAEWTVCLEKFREGFDLYHAKKFTEAKLKFQEALAARPGDPVSELYIERCDEYLQDPPPENWDGVHVMKTK